MRSINLYTFSRTIDANLLSLYEKILSDRASEIKVKVDEVLQIRKLVNRLRISGIDDSKFNNWFYSFTIPQLSKEFDLLKIGKNNIVINIELKSQIVSSEKIEKQLVQNRYYLGNIAEQIYSFTCVNSDKCNMKVYQYIDNTLRESSIAELMHAMNLIDEALEEGVEKLFKPKDYLISPFNTPSRFIEGHYFLNENQQKIKNEIMKSIEKETALWGIKGSAGTGKSLLLYDIAKTLSDKYVIGIIHSGIINKGHKQLDKQMNNVSIIGAKSLSEKWISNFDIICVDEAQRLYIHDLKMVQKAFKARNLKACIFSYDPIQILSYSEKRRNTVNVFGNEEGFQERELSDKIRTNREIYLFIRGLLRLYDTPDKSVSYNNIEVVYANSTREADIIISQYTKKGFVHISFTPSKYNSNSIDHYSNCINTHHVIGQEFDNVLVVLDGNFLYSEQGELEARKHPNPDYIFPKLFYQNISRAREKLCIVVLNNEDVFDKLLKLKAHELHYHKPEVSE